MATSSVLHSACIAHPLQSLGSKCTSTSLLLPSSQLPRRQPSAGVHRMIRCQAKPDGTQDMEKTSKEVSKKVMDVMAFDGPGPERINGRLAMVGFVTALAIEFATGNDLFAQLQSGGVPWFLYATGLLSVGSLVPLFQGVSPESKSGQLMTSDAEIWNGRAAMVGLVALAVTEYVKGGPLV